MEDMKKLTEEEMEAVAGGKHHHHHHPQPEPVQPNEDVFPSLGHQPGEQFQNNLGEWFYVVKSGDTLYDIALHYNTTVGALRARNWQIHDPDNIRVGFVLYICESWEQGFINA